MHIRSHTVAFNLWQELWPDLCVALNPPQWCNTPPRATRIITSNKYKKCTQWPTNPDKKKQRAKWVNQCVSSHSFFRALNCWTHHQLHFHSSPEKMCKRRQPQKKNEREMCECTVALGWPVMMHWGRDEKWPNKNSSETSRDKCNKCIRVNRVLCLLCDFSRADDCFTHWLHRMHASMARTYGHRWWERESRLLSTYAQN